MNFQDVKKWLHLLGYNWKALLGFELLYKMITVSLALPGFRLLLNAILKITGYPYLTKQNLPQFFTSPLTIICILLILILMTFYTLIDMGAVIFILDQSSQNHKTTVGIAFRWSVKKACRMFLPQNLPMVVVTLFMLPFLHLGFGSSLISSLNFVHAATYFIVRNQWLQITFAIGFVLLYALWLRWVYIFHYYELEGWGFFFGARKSARLGRGHHIVDGLILLVLQLILAGLYYLTSFLGIFLIFMAKKICDAMGMVGIVISSGVVVLLGILLVSFFALSLPVSFATISVLYYKRKGQRNEPDHRKTPLLESRISKKLHRRMVQVGALIFAGAILLSAFTIYQTYHGKLSLDVEHVRQTQVTAHRGASHYYPENTMAAFKGAEAQGADWIELDVQQSKDEKIFVMHDSSFKRTTGVAKRAWELDWADIQKLDAGSSFSRDFEGERIPLLNTVLRYCKKTGMRANIELKPSGHEVDFEKSVVEIVQKNHMEKNCVVTSQDYSVLHRVKECDRQIRTVYVMSVAIGNIGLLRDADDFSIEYSFITESLVRRLHNGGHEVYAWTVDTYENMDRMINMGVDNIITDDVPLGRDRIAKSRTTNAVDDLIGYMQKIFG